MLRLAFTTRLVSYRDFVSRLQGPTMFCCEPSATTVVRGGGGSGGVHVTDAVMVLCEDANESRRGHSPSSLGLAERRHVGCALRCTKQDQAHPVSLPASVCRRMDVSCCTEVGSTRVKHSDGEQLKT